jgi:hypothetical protein
MITGLADAVDDPEILQRAVDIWGMDVPEKYDLFVFSVDRAIATKYSEERIPVRYQWKKDM